VAAVADPGATPRLRLTYDQLHEKACVECGDRKGLTPAGHREVDGLTWAVVACAEHAGEAS